MLLKYIESCPYIYIYIYIYIYSFIKSNMQYFVTLYATVTQSQAQVQKIFGKVLWKLQIINKLPKEF